MSRLLPAFDEIRMMTANNIFISDGCTGKYVALFFRSVWFILAGYLLSACAAGPGGSSSFVIRDDVDVRPEVRADFEKAVMLLQKQEKKSTARKCVTSKSSMHLTAQRPNS